MENAFILENKRTIPVSFCNDVRLVHLDNDNICFHELERQINCRFNLCGRRIVIDFEEKEGCLSTIRSTKDLLHFLQLGIKLARITFLAYDQPDSQTSCSEVNDHKRLNFSQLPVGLYGSEQLSQKSGLGIFHRRLLFERCNNPNKTRQEFIIAAQRRMDQSKLTGQRFNGLNQNMEKLSEPVGMNQSILTGQRFNGLNQNMEELSEAVGMNESSAVQPVIFPNKAMDAFSNTVGKARRKSYKQHNSPYEVVKEFSKITKEYGGIFQRRIRFERYHNPNKTMQEHMRAAQRWMIESRLEVQRCIGVNKNREELSEAIGMIGRLDVQSLNTSTKNVKELSDSAVLYELFQARVAHEKYSNPNKTMPEHVLAAQKWLLTRKVTFERLTNPNKNMEEVGKTVQAWMIQNILFDCSHKKMEDISTAAKAYGMIQNIILDISNKSMEELSQEAEAYENFHAAGEHHPIQKDSNVALHQTPMFCYSTGIDPIASANSASDISTANFLSKFNNMSIKPQNGPDNFGGKS